MTTRSEHYPLDVSTRYPAEQAPAGALIHASDRLAGLVVNPDTGDLTNDLLYQTIRAGVVQGYKTLAYCDLIDLAQEAAGTRLDHIEQSMGSQIGQLQSSVTTLKASLDSLMAFFGVIVPAWTTKEEVENGDEMGMARPSAAEAGLTVTYEFVRQEPGFDHEAVVSTDPPAGTLVTRGSAIRVVINLQG
jgi:hypothetical protein